MSLWPAIISGGLGLFGANRAEKREAAAIAAMNEYNKPLNVRKRAEEGGFNPLLFAGPGVGQQTAVGGTNYMGEAMANAGMMLGDAVAQSIEKRQTLAKLNAYQDQNQKLTAQVEKLTLRPDVPGIYLGGPSPTRSEALGYGSVSDGSGRADRGADGGGEFDLSAGEPGVTSTQTTYQTPGVVAQTTLPEGIDAEDVATGIALDGINRAKADGNLPQKWEQPFVRAGQNAAYGLAVALDRTHRGVYYGLRALNPYGAKAKRNADALSEQFGADWWKHQPKGAW